MTKRITKAVKPVAPSRLRMVAIDADQDDGRFQMIVLKAEGAAAVEAGMRLVKAALGKP
ncbi:hypothetical protein AFCDBAGC_4444 [Methylobacterium cerastii]|uniref:Uncharacterized protein n=1 Tax=Methylobacterium cerastii TaxID=932741 RepID=A0ABQ4QN00_9HYPH|nr:hypothetical protein [Methylobacterium cerastii]GJD46562.1 hypothetical protein AFCDBAGC_4444 [Methylobacterium cerastii]